MKELQRQLELYDSEGESDDGTGAYVPGASESARSPPRKSSAAAKGNASAGTSRSVLSRPPVQPAPTTVTSLSPSDGRPRSLVETFEAMNLISLKLLLKCWLPLIDLRLRQRKNFAIVQRPGWWTGPVREEGPANSWIDPTSLPKSEHVLACVSIISSGVTVERLQEASISLDLSPVVAELLQDAFAYVQSASDHIAAPASTAPQSPQLFIKPSFKRSHSATSFPEMRATQKLKLDTSDAAARSSGACSAATPRYGWPQAHGIAPRHLTLLQSEELLEKRARQFQLRPSYPPSSLYPSPSSFASSPHERRQKQLQALLNPPETPHAREYRFHSSTSTTATPELYYDTTSEDLPPCSTSSYAYAHPNALGLAMASLDGPSANFSSFPSTLDYQGEKELFPFSSHHNYVAPPFTSFGSYTYSFPSPSLDSKDYLVGNCGQGDALPSSQGVGDWGFVAW